MSPKELARTVREFTRRRTLVLVVDALRKGSMRGWVRRPSWAYWFDVGLLVYWIVAILIDLSSGSWWGAALSAVMVYLHLWLVVFWPWRGLREHRRLEEERAELVAEHLEYIERMYGKDDEDGGLGRSRTV